MAVASIEITHEGYGESYGLTHNRICIYPQMEPIYEEKKLQLFRCSWSYP